MNRKDEKYVMVKIEGSEAGVQVEVEGKGYAIKAAILSLIETMSTATGKDMEEYIEEMLEIVREVKNEEAFMKALKDLGDGFRRGE